MRRFVAVVVAAVLAAVVAAGCAANGAFHVVFSSVHPHAGREPTGALVVPAGSGSYAQWLPARCRVF
ncbi:MAG: hypothetical protein M0Z44_04740 [Gammaproteobacteria bacterium]|nr:hypothetical protein [Gammaproteobacteria bacterium]